MTHIIPPDDQDKRLGKSGDNSLFQRARHLSAQQRQLLDLILSGVDETEALRQAGYKSRGALASLRNKVPDLMDRLGLTDEYLINEKLKPLLDAEETKFFKTTGIILKPGSDGESADELEYTELIESPARPALDIRRNALDMAFKLRGSYARPQDNGGADGGDINVNIVMVGA